MAKPLKDQNRWLLWLVIAANIAVFHTIAQSGTIAALGVKGLLTSTTDLLPVGLALAATSIVNGLLAADLKARLVYLRWHNALPGHRAFSKYAPADARVDVDQLKAQLGDDFPNSPDEENRAWYRLFKEVETAPGIIHTHREFLFARDYTAVSAFFLVAFGGTAFALAESDKVALIYGAVLAAQFLLVRQAAANYGVRLVTTVLAHKSSTTN